MQNKKYYTISEVAESLGVSQNVLRYAEKNIPKILLHACTFTKYEVCLHVDSETLVSPVHQRIMLICM